LPQRNEGRITPSGNRNKSAPVRIASGRIAGVWMFQRMVLQIVSQDEDITGPKQ
jgi:hypothetical protein